MDIGYLKWKENMSPFIVLKLENVTTAPRESFKGFYAYFKLLLVNPETNNIKDYSFKISMDSYNFLKYIDDIINHKEVKDVNDSILNNFASDVKELNLKEPLKIVKNGEDYQWYLLSKFIEICEKV